MNANAEQTSDPARAVRDALRETSRLDPLGWPVPPFDVVEAWEPIDRAAALAWAQERSESYRAELEFELDPPDALEKWIADQWSPDQDEDDPPTDAEPPPRPPRDPWNISGEPILSQRGQLAAVDLWTDAARARAALTDPRTHPKARSRLGTIVTDLERIAEIEMQLRADAAELGARVALSPGAEADLGDIEARATASRRRSSAGAVSEARRVLALAPTLALAAAREGTPTPTPTPAEPAPAAPQAETPAAPDALEPNEREVFNRLRQEHAAANGAVHSALSRLGLTSSQRFVSVADNIGLLVERLSKAPEPPAEDPVLAPVVERLRVAIDCGPGFSAAEILGRAVREIEGLRRKIDRQAEEATSLRIEVDNLRAALSSREKQVANFALLTAPSWHTEGLGLVYSAPPAPPPPILARVEPDLDEPIWHWSVGDTIGRKRGTAPSQEDAQKICDLFLNLEAK